MHMSIFYVYWISINCIYIHNYNYKIIIIDKYIYIFVNLLKYFLL